MKNYNSNSLILLFGIIFFVGCGNSNAEQDAGKNQKENTSAETSKPAESPASLQKGGILGEWSLYLEAYDDNSNKILDANERQKGIKNHYFYRFNADSSCIINTVPVKTGGFKGHFETKMVNGKKRLLVYRDPIKGEDEGTPPPDSYIIISLSDDELVLLETMGDNTFWIFKRYK